MFTIWTNNTNRKTSGLHSVYHLDQQYKQKNIRSPQCLPSGPTIQTEKHQVSTVFTIWTNNKNRKTSGLHSVYHLDQQYKQKNIRSPQCLPSGPTIQTEKHQVSTVFTIWTNNTNKKTSGLHSVYHLDQQYKQKNIRSPQCLPSGPIIQTEKHQVSTVFTIWTNNTNRKTSGLHSVYHLDQ